MLKSRHFLFLLAFTSFVFSQQTAQDPYQNLRLLPFDLGTPGTPPGTLCANAKHLESLIKDHQVRTIIEIGSWLGASTRHMASLLPDDGKLYAIDHWNGSAEHQPGHPHWHKSLPNLYQQFLSNVVHVGLTEKIVPLRMTSQEGASYLSRQENRIYPDLIYIDADHSSEAVYEDLHAWYPFVKGHGILCGDAWGWKSVRLAVEAFAAEMHMEIEISDNLWRLRE